MLLASQAALLWLVVVANLALLPLLFLEFRKLRRIDSEGNFTS